MMGAGRHAVVFASLLLVASVVSGCSGQTRGGEAYSFSVGSNTRTEQVDALGFAIVVDGEGNGRMVGTLLNTENQPHALTGASIKSEGTPVRSALLIDVVRLPPEEPVNLIDQAPVSVPADNLTVGSFVELTLDVTDAELVEMLVPVESQVGPYADVEVT